MKRAYRTTTPDSEHLSKALSAKPTTEEHFAELRANEFMGSLLVPDNVSLLPLKNWRPCTTLPSIAIHPQMPTTPDTALRITADAKMGMFDMERFEKALATRFGVNRRFIQVRLNRYGLTTQEATMHWA